jgi:1-acyl-sn-glycerol-3-phosphate acyltransferase
VLDTAQVPERRSTPLPIPGARVAGSLLGAAAGAMARGAGALVPRFRAGDMDDRDPDAMRELLPGSWLIVSAWYRPEVRGLHHIPASGPALIVGNHTGGSQSPEVLISSLAIASYFGVERPFYQLAHRMVMNSPLAPLLRRFGTVEADRRNADRVLQDGALLQVFPGGDHEVYRPSWESGRIDFGGRKGFIRLALKNDVPIVPQVTIGGQEQALFLSRGEWLAKLLGTDRALRLKTIPIFLAPPFGLVVGPFTPFLPLPSKVVVQWLAPIDVRATYGEDPDLDDVYDDIVARMQDVLTSLRRERRLPVLG